MEKTSLNLYSLKSRVYDYAIDTLNLDDCRFTSPFLSDETTSLMKDWLAKEYHGDMAYLKRHIPFKENPNLLLDNVQSAIVLIKNYKNTTNRKLSGPNKIARYAAGKDYHGILKAELNKLVDFMKAEENNIECFVAVDSRPVAERNLALKSGIGFLGKNTLVIKPGLGSYFFIGVILTNYAFDADPAINWNCGKCRLCLDTCPTQALNEDLTMDARKCLSYQTIEQKTPLTAEQRKNSKGWIFGCDICQEVCPYNHEKIPLTDWPSFLPSAGVGFRFQGSTIPRHTPLYRSRKQLLANVTQIKNL
jgi:epoxyqueuosine reductase